MAPPRTPVPEADRIAAAQSYIDALTSHDADPVPFARGCTRIEQGVKNGFSGNHLRRSLRRGPQYRLIASADAPRYEVTGDQVRARYDISTRAALRGRRVCAHVDETFTIPAEHPDEPGCIHHIVVAFRPYVRRER